MIQNPSVGSRGSGGVEAENGTVVFATNPDQVNMAYCTVQDGEIVFKKIEAGPRLNTIYPLRNSVLYLYSDIAYSDQHEVQSGATVIYQGTRDQKYMVGTAYRVN